MQEYKEKGKRHVGWGLPHHSAWFGGASPTLLICVMLLGATGALAQDVGFKPIFDGKTLDGWKAPDMSHWSVRDGAIVGQTTPENPVKSNQFLVWQLGDVDDFEVKLKYRISGTDRANSGIQIRSRVAPEGHVVGYQADIDRAGRYAGALYDERGRGMLAQRGEKTVIAADGKMTKTPFGDAQALMSLINKDGWNEYHIIAKGDRIILKVNGKKTADVQDLEKKNRELSGVLALQLHAGPPMKVEFKDIRLKRIREDGFKPIFDGKTLAGWKAPNMSYWSVEDGAITAEATEQNPVTKNQFLVWQAGELDDFELKLKYRIAGTDRANSGIQIRSKVAPDGHAVGYQADIDMTGRYAGALYDEHGRGMLAERGQRTVIGADGRKTHTSIGDAEELMKVIKKGDWNEYHIIARGRQITLKINGKVTAEVLDNDEKNRDLSGVLALQLHSGPPMKVQFKDIRLKRLKLADRKKIVLVAGPKSHGHGSHEHNAGMLLLGRLLNENMPQVYATTYLNGWPKDPTAIDNADAIAVFCDGGGGHVARRNMEEVDAAAKKGAGIAMLHYAVEVPKGRAGNYMLDWTGGYYETYWSVNPHWNAEFKELPDHPITRGVKPFSMEDEWYYHMRFVEEMENVTPILTATPPDSTRKRRDGAHSGNKHVRARMGMPEHVAWAYDRPGGGRGFGFTGGHWHWSWASNDFRKLVLNALVWISGVDVPAGGVASKTPTIEELEANQDYPMSKRWNRRKIKEMIAEWNKS
ncbi:MAG: family 16 glycoside hydrolase [Planctomycetota bacterium]